MRAFSRRRRSLSVVLMAALVSACTSWHVEKLSPEEAIAKWKPKEVRLVTIAAADGSETQTRYRLLDPWATPDSIGGTRCEIGRDECVADYRTAVASVSQLEVNRAGTRDYVWVAAILLTVTAFIATVDFDLGFEQ